MPLIQSKQVQKFIAGRVYTAGQAFVAGAGVSSFNATAALTTTLLTAGDGGVAVPLQAAVAQTSEGVIFTVDQNLVEIYSNATKLKLTDASGNEVYGRILLIAGAYTVNLLVRVAGIETVYVPPSNLTLDFVTPYLFTFATLPSSFATGLKAAYVADDPAGSGARTKMELVSVTALNTLSALASTYVPGQFVLFVNGQAMNILDGSVTVVGTAVTWVPAVTGYNLQTTDTVVAFYTY